MDDMYFDRMKVYLFNLLVYNENRKDIFLVVRVEIVEYVRFLLLS